MLLIDLTHTSHTQARTGVQRVCRSLHTALSASAEACQAVTHDPYWQTWRPLASWEQKNLQSTAPAAKRSARWPWTARWSGRAARLLRRAPAALSSATGLIAPEIFSPAVHIAYPALFHRVSGPRVAIFHDAIALRFPELTPQKTVGRFPLYLRELLAFDGIAAVSEDSRQSLLEFWRWAGIDKAPPVETIPLGIDVPAAPPRAAPSARPVILSVGTIEGRKNHVALLEACADLWAQGEAFDLHLIGLAHPQTGRDGLARLRALQAEGRPLRYDGPVDEAGLETAYRNCTFTVYPSLMEGFGLPVLESVARGKPCICSNEGALGESAAGGGCLTVSKPDTAALTHALRRLLREPATRQQLSDEAARRRFRNWTDYARDLTGWMATLRRRVG